MTSPHDRPFRVRDAIRAGYSRSSIDSRHFDMPFHGIRSALGSGHDVLSRCEAYRLTMRPDAAFGSLTAALIWGIPLPADIDLDRLHVSVPHGMPRPRSRGVIGTERAASWSLVTRDGLRVLDEAATWASLGTALRLTDLVAAGDHLLSTRNGAPPLEVSQLRSAIIRKAPGAARLNAAARFVRPGSLSRPESLLRVLLTTAGVPEPHVNFPLDDLRVVIDLAWPEARFGIEYHGDHHRDPAQFGADIRRQERIHDSGWLLMTVTRYDLFDNWRELLTRARSRLRERGIRSQVRDPPMWAVPRR